MASPQAGAAGERCRFRLANQGRAICPTGETRKPATPKDRLRRVAGEPCWRSGEQVPRPPKMHGRALRAFRRTGHEKPDGITKTAAARPSRKERLSSQQLRPSDFVSLRVGRSPFRVRRGGGPDGARQRHGLARGLAQWRLGGPCRTAAQPPADDDGFRVSRGAPCR